MPVANACATDAPLDFARPRACDVRRSHPVARMLWRGLSFPDGIHFQGLSYLDTALAAYVGEDVIIRYDRRDMAELRVYFHDEFVCRAINSELASENDHCWTSSASRSVVCPSQIRRGSAVVQQPRRTRREYARWPANCDPEPSSRAARVPRSGAPSQAGPPGSAPELRRRPASTPHDGRAPALDVARRRNVSANQRWILRLNRESRPRGRDSFSKL